MASDTLDEKAIFNVAREISSPDARREYLRQICGQDHSLLERVETLLQAYEEQASFLESPPVARVTATLAQPLVEGPGTQIGPYKLLQEIGEGGMGVVYMAEQHEPIRRKVALKIIKPGMDTRQVIARFEAERQALAMMDHPNIARVLDAGTLDSGRPYFVIELVFGVSITEFCDAQKLPLRERLGLFIDVCRAVQHAHQKGIVHRDLKPSNILITMNGDQPMPKVIDFGVSKALNQPLTEKTLFTAYGQMIGTPRYMSPEQAQLSTHDVDTRSDVYSLGVLLYELLTGKTPFDDETLQKSGIDEVRRIIREVEPPRPSVRVSTLRGEMLSTISDRRRIDARKLGEYLRCELDWIVMKTLEKDRNRRYESASALAADVNRYLNDEPVHACPPSFAYRCGKLVRRHKGSLAVAAGLFLIVTTMAATIGWVVRDHAAQRMIVASRVRNSLNTAQTLIDENKLTAARQKLAEARAQLGSDRAPPGTLAAELEAAEAELDRFQQFVELIDRAHEAETAPLLETTLASSDSSPTAPGSTWERRPDAAVPLLLQALQRYAILARDDWGETLESGILGKEQIEHIRHLAYEELLWLADDLVHRQEDHASANRLTREAAAQSALEYLRNAETAHRPTPAFYALRAQCRQALGEETASAADRQLADLTPPALAIDYYFRGQAAYEGRKFEEAVQAFQAALRLEPTHYWSLMKLGYCLCDLGQNSEDAAGAVHVFTGCILHRPNHAHAYNCRGIAFGKLHQYAEALADYGKAIELDSKSSSAWYNRGVMYSNLAQREKALVDFSKAIELDPKDASAWYNRGTILVAQGKLAEAEADYREALRLRPEFSEAHNNLGSVLRDQGKQAEAEAEYREALRVDANNAKAHFNLGNCLRKRGKRAEAEAEYREALRLRPEFSEAHHNLGSVLRDQGKHAEAEAEYRQALQLRPEYPEAHNDLGNALVAQQMHAAAEAEYREALRLRPEFPEALFNLGACLADQGKHAEAESAYRQALGLRSDLPSAHIAHNKLGNSLSAQGKYAEAEAEYREALHLQPSYSRALSNLGILLRKQGKPAAVARLYSDSFAADPTLAEGLEYLNRYNAACAAALVGCGLANEVTGLDEAECARLRRQALDWLRADLAAWETLLKNEPDQRARVRQGLRMWQQDADFSGVRGDALANLPDAEQQAWRQLWADIERILNQVNSKDTQGTERNSANE